MAESGVQKTAEQVGAVVNASPEAAKFTAKILKWATDSDGGRLGLWPSPGSGVRKVLFSTTHLTNQLVALGCGTPGKAAETVLQFRSMVPEHGMHRTSTITEVVQEGPNALIPKSTRRSTLREANVAGHSVISGKTFGEALDWLVDQFASPETGEEFRDLYRRARVIVTIEPYPSARIILHFPPARPGDPKEELDTTYRPEPSQADLLPTEPEQVNGELQRVFYGTAFEALANILSGVNATSGRSTVPSGGQKQSTNRNAALAGAASDTSLPVEPREARTALASPNSSHDSACVCSSSIGLRRGADFPSCWSQSHERPNHYAST